MVNHPQIEAVSQGGLEDIDDNAFTFYPFANVSILDATFNPTTTDYLIQIVVADKIKNKNNESNSGNNYVNNTTTNAMKVPFEGPDDRVDIWANTLGIVNDLTSYTQYSVESFQINDAIVNEPFYERFNNGLAGWVSTFTLTTHNARPRCLYDLYPSGSFVNQNCD